MNTVLAARESRSGREYWLPTLELAAREVFELMVGCCLEIPASPPSEDELDVISMVGLAGQLCGMLTLRCRAQAAARMASQMLGLVGDQANSQMWDAVGEICNMVAGNFKNKISGLGDGCVLSVPTVITGADYSMHSLVNEQIRSVLLFEGDPIVLTLEIHH